MRTLHLTRSGDLLACKYGDGNIEWLKETLSNGLTLLTSSNQSLNVNLTKIKITIEKLEEEDSKCGTKQRILKESITKS